MNSSEMLRLIDSISRDRNVEKESLFRDIEQAMVSAARKRFDAMESEEFSAEVDRMDGRIRVWREGEEIPLEVLGRIPAQTAKQVMIQRFREDERTSIYNEFIDRVGELTTGMAQRYEGGGLVVQIGRAEAFMPRSEQIRGEQYQPGERVRCLILDVRDTGHQVKIVLSRAAPDFIRRLFEVEVPEVSERIIEIKAMAREAGHRTKLAVSSIDSKVDAVGACVGVRGSRIKNIVDELGGEKLDIVRWNESSQILIQNALKPAEVVEISLCFELGRATVVVNEDQLSLAIGKRGQNVRLAARLTNWDVDILTPAEYTRGLDTLETCLMEIDGMTAEHVDRLAALGVISVFDVEEVGHAYLTQSLGIDEALGQQLIDSAAQRAKVVAEEQAREKAEAERRKTEAAAATEGLPGEQQAAAVLGELPGGPSASAGAGAAEREPVESGGYTNRRGGEGQGPGGGGRPSDAGSIVEMLEARQSQEVQDQASGDQTVDSVEARSPATEPRAEGEADVGQPRDAALAEDAGSSDAAQARAQEADQPVESPWQPGTDPTGTDPNSVELTEAEQEGSAAEMLGDATTPEAGTVGGSPDEAKEDAASSRSSMPTGDVEQPTPQEDQAEVVEEKEDRG